MPGNSPVDAVDAFLEPVQRAVSCLGSAKVNLSPKGRSALGRVHLMSINDTTGMLLSDSRHRLELNLHYEIVRSDDSQVQPFRVTTRSYLHSLSVEGGAEVLAAHWHPTGVSDEHAPHWHVGAAALADDGVFTPRAHIPSPRVSVETMVRVCIEQLGCAPARGDWRSVLERGEADFVGHRSWS